MSELRTYKEDCMGNITIYTPYGTAYLQGDDASALLMVQEAKIQE